MTIYVIFGQRHCNYCGEHAPEVLDACDEWTWDEQPQQWIDERIAVHVSSKEFVAVKCVKMEVPTEDVRALLTNEPKNVMAKIVT